LRYYERALTLVRASDDRQRVYSCLVAMQLLGGEQDTAIAAPVYREAEFWKRCGDEALALAREMGWVAGEAFALAMRSFTAGPRGALGPALADAQAAVALAERAGHRQWITAARLALGMAWMALHQLEHASSAMDAALTDARRIGSIFWVSSVAAGLASLWIEQGNLVRAEALLEEVSSSERLGASSGQRQCWYARAELALSRQQPERALDYIDRLLESRPHPESDHGIPALTKLRGDALTQLGRTAEAEAEYRGAREGACLFGYLPLLWRVDAAHGALLLAEGRTTEAETAVHAARSTIAGLAESIDADAVREHFHAAALARLPVLPEPDSARSAGLSPRELEVLRLLSEGQSDREIADALSISPRTVMRHVSGIFDKLGVGSRTAAATLAIRRNLV
jgi:DNA-binding CsgD family transcriptional regulator/tetratricopeptide (TPR) repeat protein